MLTNNATDRGGTRRRVAGMTPEELCRNSDYAKAIMRYAASDGHDVCRADILISGNGTPYARIHNRLHCVSVRHGMWDYSARLQVTKPA